MLEGKTVVVTGAASGIGRATAVDLHSHGATVIGVDRQPMDDVDHAFSADMSDPAEIDHLVGRLPEGVDGLCNIAGLPPTHPPEMVLAVNAKGLERLTAGLVPKMNDGASIVNMASLSGIGWADSVDLYPAFEQTEFDIEALRRFAADHDMGSEGRSYFFSKEYVVYWTMRSRWAWRDRGIRINVVSPGPIETPILPDFKAVLGRAERVIGLVGEPGSPRDVAPLVSFLISDAASWITGANFAVDWGISAHLTLERHGRAE